MAKPRRSPKAPMRDRSLTPSAEPEPVPRPPVVRDNVLGRRPSKTDPLGEQPGTVGHNPEQVGPNNATTGPEH